MANKQRDGAKEAFWRDAVKRQAAGGQSVRAFCRQHGLAESNFYAWRRTIGQRDAEPAKSGRRNGKVNRTKAGPTFVPAVVTGDALRDAGIVLELAGGRRLRLPESTPPERLAAIVHALEAEAAS